MKHTFQENKKSQEDALLCLVEKNKMASQWLNKESNPLKRDEKSENLSSLERTMTFNFATVLMLCNALFVNGKGLLQTEKDRIDTADLLKQLQETEDDYFPGKSENRLPHEMFLEDSSDGKSTILLNPVTFFISWANFQESAPLLVPLFLNHFDLRNQLIVCPIISYNKNKTK